MKYSALGRVPSEAGRVHSALGRTVSSGGFAPASEPSSREVPSAERRAPSAEKRRLGVIGTFVWDTIHGRDPAAGSIQEWGGISYALSALDAALPDDWEIVPLVKVGYDLAQQAREFVRDLPRIARDAALVEVPHLNNRVELRYLDSERRCEQLTGGIPGWTWVGLSPLLRDLDALYINFLSGWELDLQVLQLIRQHFRGPIYCDLHMLVMAVQPGGMRAPEPLPDAEAWCRCVDLLQVNEEEASMMAADPMALAAMAMNAGVSALTVTLGSRGAVYFAAPGFERLSDLRTGGAVDAPALGPVRTALVPPARGPLEGDPTGCGDVWGATYFSRLLAGDTLSVAMSAAHRAAARNVEHRGATGLSRHLRGELTLR